MTVTQLIAILQENLDSYGDREVFYLEHNKAYPIAYLGSGSSEFGNYFWFSCDTSMTGEAIENFKAPGYRPDLTVVK